MPEYDDRDRGFEEYENSNYIPRILRDDVYGDPRNWKPRKLPRYIWEKEDDFYREQAEALRQKLAENEKIANFTSVEKLTKAIEASGDYLTEAVVEELEAVFSPATLATMVGVFGIYVASHATGVGQAADILMLLAGGIFFGLDTISIFKDLAGFGNAINATTQKDLDKAGKHLADLVATVSVDLLMTLLTSKVADKISSGINKTSGVEKPGTTTGDMDDINRSIRKRNPADNSNQIYSVEDIGNEIVKDSLATKAYERINNQGLNVILDKRPLDSSSTAGEFDPIDYEVRIYESNNFNAQEATSTIIHESTHVDYRLKKRIKTNSQYEEYRAACREFLYNNKRRPSLKERQVLWDEVKERYPNLRIGKQPLKNYE